MRTLPWLLAAMLIAAPALTGCIGFGDDTDGEDEPGNETNESDDTGNDSDNASDANDTSDDGFGDDDEDGAEWQEEDRTGTVSPTSQLTGEGVSETFSVPDGTEALMLNLSADGGELNMCIQKPGDDSGNQTEARSAQQDACDEEQSTEDGNASFQASGPEPGEWTVELTAAEGTTSEVEYTLTIAQLVPEDAETSSGGSGTGNATVVH